MENRTFFQNCPRTKYIYIYRVPQCMSPRLNWDSPTPSPPSECAPPRVSHNTRLRVRGWESPNCDNVGKSSAPCLLCVPTYL